MVVLPVPGGPQKIKDEINNTDSAMFRVDKRLIVDDEEDNAYLTSRGIGIGLLICKQLAKQLNIKLTCNNIEENNKPIEIPSLITKKSFYFLDNNEINIQDIHSKSHLNTLNFKSKSINTSKYNIYKGTRLKLTIENPLEIDSDDEDNIITDIKEPSRSISSFDSSHQIMQCPYIDGLQ